MIALLLKETQALAAYWGAFALLGLGTILFSPLSPSSLDNTQSLQLADWGMQVFLVLLLLILLLLVLLLLILLLLFLELLDQHLS